MNVQLKYQVQLNNMLNYPKHNCFITPIREGYISNCKHMLLMQIL